MAGTESHTSQFGFRKFNGVAIRYIFGTSIVGDEIYQALEEQLEQDPFLRETVTGISQDQSNQLYFGLDYLEDPDYQPDESVVLAMKHFDTIGSLATLASSASVVLLEQDYRVDRVAHEIPQPLVPTRSTLNKRPSPIALAPTQFTLFDTP